MAVHDRRDFLRVSAAAVASAIAAPGMSAAALTTSRAARQTAPASAEPLFLISLAQWSLHRAFETGTLDPLDFPAIAKRDYGIDAIEYVNQFYIGKTSNDEYLRQLKQRAADHGVRCLLIMCDGEGRLGDPDNARRSQAVANHRKWLDWAKELGCHSIRVNAASSGSRADQHRLAVDGLTRLAEIAAALDLNVLVENHGGLSSNGAWLARVISEVRRDQPRCGTLPDFGNFHDYDRYQGVRELMPMAQAVSAKSYDFDEHGNETSIDYPRMLKIVAQAGYRKHVGIEYEGERLSEEHGIRATRALLERVRDELTAQSP